MADIKRMRYFDQQLLVLKDFTDEQDYHREMRRRHNRSLHTSGVANGLDVTKTGAKEVTVKSGMAIDNQGREIVLEADTKIDLSNATLFPPSSSVLVTISYAEELTDPSASDNTQNTRIKEKFNLVATKETVGNPPDSSAVQLARVVLDAQGNFGTPDLSVRKLAGASAFDNPEAALTVRSLRLSNPAFPNTQWPTLTASGANQVTVGGSLLAQNLAAVSDINLNGSLKAGGDLSGRNLSLTGNLSVTGALSALANAGVTGNLTVGGILGTGANVGIGTSSPENSEGWSRVLDVLGGPHTKLSLRTTNIDARVVAHETGWWGGPVGMVVGTKGNHALSLATNSAARVTIQPNGSVGIGTTTPGATLDVVGSMRSTMWDVFQLYSSQPGPLTLSKQFSTSGGTLVIFASGSGFIGGGGGHIGMEIRVDNVNKATVRVFTNEGSSHKAFVSNPIVVAGIAAGTHTLSLVALAGVATDANDFFSVTVFEMPWVTSTGRPPIVLNPGDIVLGPRP